MRNMQKKHDTYPTTLKYRFPELVRKTQREKEKMRTKVAPNFMLLLAEHKMYPDNRRVQAA